MAQVFQKCKEDEKSRNYPCTTTRCGHPWTVRYREPGGRGGRQRERSFEKKGDADSFAAKVEREKDLGTYIAPTGLLVPLVAVYREFIDSGSRVNGTRYQYETSLRLHVEPYFGSTAVGAVKPKHLNAWLKWMVEERGYEESTAINRYETLAGVFSFAVANEYITKNPCQYVRTGRQRVKRRVKKTIRLPAPHARRPRLAQLGLTAVMREERTRALSLLEQALAISETRGDTWHRCYLLWILAVVHGEAGKIPEALDCLRCALRLVEEIEERMGEAVLSDTLAWLLASQGDARAATLVLGAVDRVWKPSGVPRHFGFAHMAAHRRRAVEQVRRTLGETAYAHAYGEGQRLALREVLRIAFAGFGALDERHGRQADKGCRSSVSSP